MEIKEGDIILFGDRGLCRIHHIEIEKIEIFTTKKVGWFKKEKISTGKFKERAGKVWIEVIGNNTGLVQAYWYIYYDWKTMKIDAIRVMNQMKYLIKSDNLE